MIDKIALAAFIEGAKHIISISETEPIKEISPMANTRIHPCPNPKCGAPVEYENGRMVCTKRCGYSGPTGWHITAKPPKNWNPQLGGYATFDELEAIKLHHGICYQTKSLETGLANKE